MNDIFSVLKKSEPFALIASLSLVLISFLYPLTFNNDLTEDQKSLVTSIQNYSGIAIILFILAFLFSVFRQLVNKNREESEEGIIDKMGLWRLLPKNLVEAYDGHKLRFRVTKDEAQTYRRD